MSNNLTYVRHIQLIRKDCIIADDHRWMIRGVDRKVRKAVKDAAKAEGVGVGTWVRRALIRAIDSTAAGPSTMTDLSEQIHILGARLSVLETSNRELHEKFRTAVGRMTKSASENKTRWRPTSKSK